MTVDIEQRSGATASVADSPDIAADAVLRATVPMTDAGVRLDQALARWWPQFSRNRLKQWIETGSVTLDGKVAAPKSRLKGGESVVVQAQPAPAESPYEPQAIELRIVHEDAAIIVLDKPAGLVAHPAAGNWDGTLLNGLLHHAPELAGVPRAGIVHRLDKDTSGLLVIARTLEAQTHLVRQMQARSVRREYVALVAGRVEEGGVVDAPIGRHPAQRTRMAVVAVEASGARPAITHFRVLQRYARSQVAATLIECRLETGRTHQIRVHMQHLGHPIVGDQTYGRAPWKSWFGRQALHARRLALEHPVTGETMAWESPLPADFEALLEGLERA